MEKEKIVKIVLKIVGVLVIIIAVVAFYKVTENKYAKEQEQLELRMKQLRKK